MRLEYVGPHDGVELPSLNIACERGQSVDVPDEVGLELIKQDGWKTAQTRSNAAKDDK